jgi:hypothetical protein
MRYDYHKVLINDIFSFKGKNLNSLQIKNDLLVKYDHKILSAN